MPHIPDLQPLGDPRLLAVGWLAADQPYNRGPIPAAFGISLLTLLKDPWQPGASAGFHNCTLCRITGGPQGKSTLWVPGKDCVYLWCASKVRNTCGGGFHPASCRLRW